MDPSTKLSDLKELIGEFCKARDWDSFHGPKDLAIGATTESAELLEIFRFLSEEECHGVLMDKKKRVDVADELADILFFVLRFAEKYDFDISSAFFEKMRKNALKYPVAKSRGSNKKYTEL